MAYNSKMYSEFVLKQFEVNECIIRNSMLGWPISYVLLDCIIRNIYIYIYTGGNTYNTEYLCVSFDSKF